LADGTLTDSIKIGDKLHLVQHIKNEEIQDSDDAKMWCIGFIVGDGCDHANKTQVRLCGNKNKYIDNFKKAGCFTLAELACGDTVASTKWFKKQDFLNGKGWKVLTPRQKAFLFLGLYSADGRHNSVNIVSSDERVIELIEECAGMAGYYITSKKEEYHDTNYKQNAYICTIRFLSNQKENFNWRLTKIKPYRGNELQTVWCVEEPITHSFMLENGIPTSNCDLLNALDMLKNTFVMGDTLIQPTDDTPFRTACNLFAQINLQVSGRQYGGQTVSWSHILPFIGFSRTRIRKQLLETWQKYKFSFTEEQLKDATETQLREEIKEGVKTYQYQILCHQSSNGQTPFVSNNLCLREAETQQELDDFAMLIEEIFNRRIKGVKDKNGHYTTPLFPKLLYWICDGLNYKQGDPYFYLTLLAARCNAFRMQPDIVSEKETRRVKEGQIIPSMGCRSLLSPIWEDTKYDVNEEFYWVKGKVYPYGTFVDKKNFSELPNGKYKYGYEEGEIAINFKGNTGWLIEKTDEYVIIHQPIVYGRWNNGVITINLPHVALEAKEKGEDFYKLLDERLELCRKGLQLRYKSCSEIKAKNSPILWQYGALARMKDEDTVGEFMKQHPLRASISLGYVGLYETCRALIGQSNTTDEGRKLSKEILQYMNNKCEEWKKEDKINYSIYGTPEESLTYKFALANRRDFGLIEHITDKDYVVNSYHVDPREIIDAFKKLEIEGEYLALSAGGAVSYVETSDLTHNIAVIVKLIQWMADHIVYAEINRVIGICYECGYEGKMVMENSEDGQFKFVCPHCGNHDDSKMSVKGRLCGYLGEINAGNTNYGRLSDIFHRTLNLDIE
jgi:ribonucleoside-triphosphate reductase